jgi:hypothetical protein
MLPGLHLARRLVRDLGPFLRTPLTVETAERLMAQTIGGRAESLLMVLERAVFDNPASPYLPLLRRGRIERHDVARWVARDGVEAALGELHDAGVYVTLDEFKGRQPIRRPGLEHVVRPHDFDNPLGGGHWEIQSGGSRSAGTRARVDLDSLTHEAASDLLIMRALGAVGRPIAIWRPSLPAGAALKASLRYAKIGFPPERWYSQNPFRPAPGLCKQWLFIRFAVAASRRYGRPLAAPVHLPLDQALVPARWLADVRRRGTPGYLDVTASGAVRVCVAARAHGLDIRGSLFRSGGEPLTEVRARIVEEAGARVFSHYHMAEVGRLGIACAAPAAVDDVHVMTGNVALLERRRDLDGGSVDGLFCTTLHPVTPKVMLNVELGDYGVLHERTCGCPFDGLGLRQHLHTIRSYEKLTTEGMHFIGTELLRLVEEVLPARFGGHATDYQLVEAEEDGLARVNLVVSPRVGPIDEARAVATALEVLGAGDAGRAEMARVWRQARTLRVVRREPHATSGGKIHALHVVGAGRRR